MLWQGVRPKDMTPDQLEAAIAYTEQALIKAANHYRLLLAGYEELAEEVQRRERSLN